MLLPMVMQAQRLAYNVLDIQRIASMLIDEKASGLIDDEPFAVYFDSLGFKKHTGVYGYIFKKELECGKTNSCLTDAIINVTQKLLWKYYWQFQKSFVSLQLLKTIKAYEETTTIICDTTGACNDTGTNSGASPR